MISIIIPVYNAQNYIADTIRSCLKQTYSDLEVIVINDCSTDESETIVNKLVNEDKRIQYYCNKENSGVIKSINYGISVSRGEYIIVLGNDDILREKHLEIGDVNVLFIN